MKRTVMRLRCNSVSAAQPRITSSPPILRIELEPGIAPGHGLGFNDLKVIECRELIAAIAGMAAHAIDFNHGLRIEKSVHAMAQSFREGRWVEIAAA